MKKHKLGFTQAVDGTKLKTVVFHTETGEKLSQSKAKAETQDRIIWEYISRLAETWQKEHVNFTCWDIHGVLFKKTPITSVRRAINTLYDQGKIEKTNERRIAGPHKKSCVVWKIK